MRSIKSDRTEEAGRCCVIHTPVGDKYPHRAGIYLLFFFLFLLLSGSKHLDAQRKSDIGFFAGTAYYMGDINTNQQFYNPSIAIGPIYRYNFNPRTSLRFSGIYHRLKASDLDFTDPYK